MSATIETPFLPIYDEHHSCYRAVIEVTDLHEVKQYYCRLDVEGDRTAIDVYEGLRDKALFQHRILSKAPRVMPRMAA